MTLESLIKKILMNDRYARDDDKYLIWKVWEEQGYILGGTINRATFMRATSTESIRRCRQALQEKYPELSASSLVQKDRNRRAAQKAEEIVLKKRVPQFVTDEQGYTTVVYVMEGAAI